MKIKKVIYKKEDTMKIRGIKSDAIFEYFESTPVESSVFYDIYSRYRTVKNEHGEIITIPDNREENEEE